MFINLICNYREFPLQWEYYNFNFLLAELKHIIPISKEFKLPHNYHLSSRNFSTQEVKNFKTNPWTLKVDGPKMYRIFKIENSWLKKWTYFWSDNPVWIRPASQCHLIKLLYLGMASHANLVPLWNAFWVS